MCFIIVSLCVACVQGIFIVPRGPKIRHTVKYGCGEFLWVTLVSKYMQFALLGELYLSKNRLFCGALIYLQYVCLSVLVSTDNFYSTLMLMKAHEHY